MRARAVFAIVCGLGLLAGSGASAETRREQSVGVAPIGADTGVPRETAMREAVRAAVLRTALDLLPEGFVPSERVPGVDTGSDSPDAWLEAKLGDDPFVYVTRFQILEDRGRRRAMFASDPDVEEEYVVLADVSVDVDAVRDRLEELGLLADGASGSGRAVTLVVEGLTSYRPLAMLRETLQEDLGVRSVVPVEFTKGRAVLAVQADRDVPGLVADLSRRAPEGLRIVVVDQRTSEATLLVEWRPPAAVESGAPSTTGGAD